MAKISWPFTGRILIVFFIILAVAGCARQMAYRFADTYLAWQARSFVSLDSEQRGALRGNIDTLLQWHAEHEMPRYHALIGELTEDLEKQNLNTERLSYYEQQMADYWLAIRQSALSPAQSLLPRLSDEQADELIVSIAGNIQERADQYKEQTTAERRDESAESIAEQVERWFGEITDEQQQIIKTWTQQMPDMTQLWIEYRVRWAEGLSEALNQRHDSEQLAALLELLFLQPEQLRSEELNELGEQSQALSRQALLELTDKLTTEQREHAIEKLNGWRTDLASMMRSRSVEI
ncbi:hypothetical protein CWE09_03075 [Aliidiomarina minuta]|uniref:Lipoprotein n=1 Tax=Aliidiomarina minuta TaxID=880057 RepID=A0A432W6M7_9GAMM|nr:DUF6279 family lipoprotein [Aliidiomarina minuta]RUO25728.1 hypothetical protein CWE09_03075 [Aliidiomarina minuta]